MSSTIAIIETQVSFTVFGRPVPKGRPRMSGKSCFTPKRTRAYEAVVSAASKKAMDGHEPFLSPVGVDIEVVRRIPVGWPKARQRMAADGAIMAVFPGDVDNYAKAALDGMNTIVFGDDKQVVRLNASKLWGNSDIMRIKVTVFREGEGV